MKTILETFGELVGYTLRDVRQDGDSIELTLENGDTYSLSHSQSCCESVTIEDISGNLQDLVGFPIIRAEENTNTDDPTPDGALAESYTWTFYRIQTVNGLVVVRFYGSSNGYYSETVDFVKTR